MCICNAPCRIEALQQGTTYESQALLKKQQHGSLDRLLPLEKAASETEKSNKMQPINEQNYKYEKYYHQINGDLFEITRKVPLTANDYIASLGNNTANGTQLFQQTKHLKNLQKQQKQLEQHHHQHQHHQQQQQQHQQEQKQQLDKQQEKHQQELQQQQTLDRKNSLTRQHSQPALKSNDNNMRLEKPQPPPRTSSRPKSTETDYINAPQRLNELIKIDVSNDTFDRSQRQRHSSRSVGGGGFERDLEFSISKNAIHQRHSSGPSELTTTTKGDMSDWPQNTQYKGKSNVRDQTNKKREIHISQALRDELLQILQQKRPIHQTDCGSNDYSQLQNNIIEWIKSQAVSKNIQITSSSKDEKTIKTVKNEQYAVPKKRHSFGHTDNLNQRSVNNIAPEWAQQQYPTNHLIETDCSRLDRMDTAASSTNADISNKFKSNRNVDHRHERTRNNRKLRHSASEVVTSVFDHSLSSSSKHAAKSSSSASKSREKYHYIYKNVDAQNGGERNTSKRERSRRNHTQRSATVSDMSGGTTQKHQRKLSSADRESSHSSSMTKCTDPMCTLMPICTNANCRLNDCYNTRRCSSLTRCSEPKCTIECYQYQSLPECMNAKCVCHSSQYACNIKHNSLPKCVSTHRFEHESSSFPRSHRSRNNSINGKLIKSASAASLNSRRRRHKTVHFGENLLREVCQNRKLIEPLQKTPSDKSTMQSNIQMLYNFVEGVLSAWVDEDDDTIRSGAESEPERGRLLKPLYICDRLRLKTISRVVHEAAQLRGTLKLGNSRYRHRHWRGTAKICNERFLRKVYNKYLYTLFQIKKILQNETNK